MANFIIKHFNKSSSDFLHIAVVVQVNSKDSSGIISRDNILLKIMCGGKATAYRQELICYICKSFQFYTFA